MTAPVAPRRRAAAARAPSAAPAHRGRAARSGRRADAGVGLQLAGAEARRHRACAAHVSRADAAVRGDRIARRSRSSPAIRYASRARIWGKVAALALFNITGWNGLLLFGVQQLPAGRSAILAYTMPIWSCCSRSRCCTSRCRGARSSEWRSACSGWRCCSATTSGTSQRTPIAALLILGASITWAFGTVLLRKWKLPMPQNTLSGWMMLLGWLPIAMLAPLFDAAAAALACRRRLVRDPLQHLLRRHARALGVVHAGAHAAGRGVVDVVAAGADRRRVRRDAASWASGRARRVGGARARRRGDGRGAVDAEAGWRRGAAG